MQKTFLIGSQIGRTKRRGLTLVELLMASAATAIIAMGLGSLAMAVYAGHEHISGRTSTAQHGRVCLERIRRYVEGATASESFPGCVVFSETSGTDSFPEILVVWSPTSTATAPTGLPRVGELVIIAPDPSNPNCLLECTRRSSTATVPALSNVSSWFTLIDQFRSTANDATRTELTNLLRTGQATRNGATTMRGAARFRVTMTPSETDWAAYRAGTKTWTSLNWPLDFSGADFGSRRITCATELQLVPEGGVAAEAIPFFGAAALTTMLSK